MRRRALSLNRSLFFFQKSLLSSIHCRQIKKPQKMTRLADDRTNASSSPSTSSRGCGFRDELNATFNALCEEMMRLLSDHNEEMNAQKKTTLVKKNFDSNASSNSSKTRKESIKDGGIEEKEDDDDDELVAKTSYVLDVASLEESDALKICLLYTSPSPRDATLSRMPSSA